MTVINFPGGANSAPPPSDETTIAAVNAYTAARAAFTAALKLDASEQDRTAAFEAESAARDAMLRETPATAKGWLALIGRLIDDEKDKSPLGENLSKPQAFGIARQAARIFCRFDCRGRAMSTGAVNRYDLRSMVGAPCPYCGIIMTRRGNHPTRDRIIPGRRGGTYEPPNVELVCLTCNNDKGPLSLVAFHAALSVENDHRAERVAAVIAKRKAKGLPV